MSRRHPCLSICLIAMLLLGSLRPAPALARAPSSLTTPAVLAAEEVPLSQGKPSFASSSRCGDGGGCLTPDYANDGLDWTFWNAHTNVLPNYPHWWKVDLGATYNIGTLVADWYTSDLYPVQYRYRIEVSDDDQTFTAVLDRTDNIITGQTIDRFSARGRWLRITIENGVLPDGGTGKDLSVYEFRVYQGGPLALEISDSRGEPVEALQLNPDGWPTLNADSGAPANPISVTVTIQNMTDTRQGYVTELSLGSSNNSARFYVSSSPCDLEFDQFSYTQIDDDCGVQLQPDQTATFQWGLWIQPSAAASLVVSAKLRWIDDGSLVDSKQAELGIPQAHIHPLVFLHGILGSMPSHNLLVTDEDTLHWRIDPFLGVYWPLPDQLQKIGYEWNKSLFVLAYDWRQPIDRSADFLAEQLREAVIPRSRPSAKLPYTAPSPKADLIGHSMGGLVARSYIQRAQGYQNDVRKVIFVATPHKGFPFDYRTWEGLTWSNYLYDAPLYSGNVFGTFGKLMDNFIWPRLVRKSFRPTDGELARDCSEGITLDVRLVFADSQGQSYTCSWNTITGYAAGGYGVVVGAADQADVQGLNFFSGVTASGQVNSYSFTYTSTATFPATPIRDDFNRADGPVGASWAGDVQEYEIQSQALAPSGGSGAIYWDTPFGPDQEAYVTLDAIDADADEIDLLLKGQGSGQCDVLEVWYQPRRSTVQVWTCHDFGIWTQHGPDIPATFQAGDRFGARARADGTVEVYKNGALIGTVIVDSSWPYHANGGRIGLWTIQAGATRLDGFGGGSLP